MANIITAIRILCSIALLFFPAFSPAFYALYITAGVSDMVDGWVARRTHTASELGAKLDTIADIVFVVVCLVKLLPVMDITTWLYVWIGIIDLKYSAAVLCFFATFAAIQEGHFIRTNKNV